ncbi:MAG: hypothetical protein C5B48_16700 [Candidatus Rokuibacteriota bacterium]|nr:MAG: hypothetical protein C5B48_16700 [Candidatus Rokubacteria bacterium]
MKTRALITLAATVAMLAAIGMPARAQSGDTNIHITQFQMRPTVDTTPGSAPFTQAGGNPNVSLFMRFCGQGIPIQSISGSPSSPPQTVTTQSPNGITSPNTMVKITGINHDQNGLWLASPSQPFDPNTFVLNSKFGTALGDTEFAPGKFVQVAPTYGCQPGAGNAGELGSHLRDFTVHLPPGFLGNPTAAPTCPEPVWVAGVCPDNTIVGHSLTETIPEGSTSISPPLNVPSQIYNVATMGLAPAQLGTRLLGSEPPGPHAIVVSVRTTGDYGIDSSLFSIPKNLGGPRALITEVDTVLCASTPCKAQTDIDPHSVLPLAGARPFFRNPTSCGDKTPRLEANSWADNPTTDKKDGPPFTIDGCARVPFDATASVAPTETTQAGGAGAQQIAIDYGHNYVDDPIWESALRGADVTLPDGMTLSPGGGNGLEACSNDQFGVDASGKQVSDAAPTCPAGSQIGTLNVTTPVLPSRLSGKVYFGPVGAPGRPTLPDNPWKLFLYIEGYGLRIKLVGSVELSPDGQIHNVFVNQPEVPFKRLEIHLNGGDHAVIANPNDCKTHTGSVDLSGWSGATKHSAPSVTPTGCQPQSFAPAIDDAGSDPQQAGANTTSHIVISRGDGQDDIKNLKLSLPAGAVGSLAAVPECPIGDAQAGNCPASTRVGTVKTTVGTGTSLLTTAGSLYLAEPQQPGDAAALALVVPAKAGPIDLGNVVVINRVMLRPSDTGVDAVTSDIPSIFGGVPLHVRRIEITVDAPGFFLNPTGCEPRPLTATFTGYSGEQATSTKMLNATGCQNLPFAPKLRLIAGAKGQNAQFQHPPLTAIVSQDQSEADIKSSQVILPDLLRPNTPEFNIPGGLCTDVQFAQNACPGPSLVGSARVVTPVLPFPLAGPVYVVQEVGSVLPKLYVVLRGRGIEVVLHARNSFLHAIQTINTFDNLPDVPQSQFTLSIKGGPGGILNNFYDACGVAKKHLQFNYSFTGQNGASLKKTASLEQEGCLSASSLKASIASRTIKVSRKGIGKLKLRCRTGKTCKGRVLVRAKGVQAKASFKLKAKKAKSIKLRFSKKEVRKIRHAKRLKARGTLTIGGKHVRSKLVLIAAKR